MDDWLIGKGATMYYPVAVPRGPVLGGDSHAAQGDSELCGTAIECSLTGIFQLILHKRDSLTGIVAGGAQLSAAETRTGSCTALTLPITWRTLVLPRSRTSTTNPRSICREGCVPEDARLPDEHKGIDRG